MRTSLGTPQEPALCPGEQVLYRMAAESEHRKLPWMLPRTAIKLCSALGMALQHSWLHVGLRLQPAGGLKHRRWLHDATAQTPQLLYPGFPAA